MAFAPATSPTSLAQVLEHDLDGVARRTEHDGRHPGAHQIRGEVHGLLERARADAELGVDDRRVIDEELAGSRWVRRIDRPARPRPGRTPIRRAACSRGLPMVAVARDEGRIASRGSARSRREPRRARGPCASRTRRGRCAARRAPRSAGPGKSLAQRAWFGRIPACSMSGLVSTMRQRSRAARRASPGRVTVVDRGRHARARRRR